MEVTQEVLASRSNPDYDNFLKGMVRAFQEVQQAKVELLGEDLFTKEANEV